MRRAYDNQTLSSALVKQHPSCRRLKSSGSCGGGQLGQIQVQMLWADMVNVPTTPRFNRLKTIQRMQL